MRTLRRGVLQSLTQAVADTLYAAASHTHAFVSTSGGGKDVYQNHGNAGATETVDLANGNTHRVVLDANLTLTFTAVTSGVRCRFDLVVVQDATGGRTITWPASVDWPGGTAPTLSPGANAVDIFTFLTVDGGTIWWGFIAGQAMA